MADPSVERRLQALEEAIRQLTGGPEHGHRPPGVVVLDDDVIVARTQGRGRYRLLNFRTGLTATDDGDRVDIDATGGGAGTGPWEADYIVDALYAGTDGDTHTALNGHTFKIYTTIQGALSAADADNVDATIVIAPKVGVGAATTSYIESCTIGATGGNTIRIVGAGRDRVTWIGATSGGVTLEATAAATRFILENLTIQAHGSPGARALRDNSGSCDWSVFDCLISSGTNAAGIAIDPGTAGVGWRLVDTQLTGNGIGISWGATSPNMYLTNVHNSCSVGMTCAESSGIIYITGGSFTGAVGMRNTASLSDPTHIHCLNVRFACSTAAVQCTSGGGFSRSSWESCDFIQSAKAFDFGTAANRSVWCRIEGNYFQANNASSTGVDDVSGSLRYSVVIGNTFDGYTAGNEIPTGIDLTDNEIGHNETDSGATLPDTHSAVGGPMEFYISFGSVKESVGP